MPRRNIGGGGHIKVAPSISQPVSPSVRASVHPLQIVLRRYVANKSKVPMPNVRAAIGKKV